MKFSLQQRPLEHVEMLQSLLYGDPPEFAMTEKVYVKSLISIVRNTYQMIYFYDQELAKFIGFNNKMNKFKKKPPPQKKK